MVANRMSERSHKTSLSVESFSVMLLEKGTVTDFVLMLIQLSQYL